jgi:hypothetical protein
VSEQSTTDLETILVRLGEQFTVSLWVTGLVTLVTVAAVAVSAAVAAWRSRSHEQALFNFAELQTEADGKSIVRFATAVTVGQACVLLAVGGTLAVCVPGLKVSGMLCVLALLEGLLGCIVWTGASFFTAFVFTSEIIVRTPLPGGTDQLLPGCEGQLLQHMESMKTDTAAV